MKKHISLLLILCLVFSMAPMSISAEASTVPSQDTVERVFGLGLMPHANLAEYIPDAPVSRGELAWILDSIYNYEDTTSNTDFTWQFYGNADLEAGVLKEAPPMALARFEDVPVSHWAYTIIEDVINAGLMKGVSATQFLPDEYMTIEQLTKSLVVLMGYEAKAEAYGGYPTGYMTVASELKLLKNINSEGVVTNADLIQMLDNCLEVDLMDYEGIIRSGDGLYSLYVSSDDNFLTGILGIDKIEDVMTDNSATTLLGASQVREGEFVIGGVKLKAEEDMYSSLLSLIGREIECYYVSSDTSKKLDYIVYAALSGQDESITIEANNFLGYNDGTFSYYENNKVKKETVSDLYCLIYNGRALSEWDESIFNITDGFITIVTDSASMDVVIIENYETWFTSAVDYDNEKVFNALSTGADNHTIAFEDYDYVTIYRADGTVGSIVDIAPNTVLNVSKNLNVLTIQICDEAATIKLERISTLNGEAVLEAGDDKYTVSNTYYEFTDRIDYKIGDELTLYMNKFGKVAWMVYGSATSYRTGYIFNSLHEENLTERVAFQIFDTTDKKALTYYTNIDKIKVSNSRGEESNKSIADFWDDYGAYRGIVRYMVDQKNALTYIEYPITDLRNTKDNKLALICETNDTDRYRFNNFGGKAIVNTSTSVIVMDPTKADEEKGYAVQTVSTTFTNEREYVTKCYTTNKDSKLAQFVVYETADRAASIRFGSTVTLYMAVVKKVVEVYDEDEGGVTAIQGFGFTRGSSGATGDVELKLTKDATTTTIMGNEFNSQIEPGDIIVYGRNEDGYVTEIRVLWDESAANPASPTGISGSFTDCRGQWLEDDGSEPPFSATSYLYEGDTTRMPNPFCLETQNNVVVNKRSNTFSSGPFNAYYGFPSRLKDGALELTTQDLTVEEFDPYGVDGKHLTRVWTLPTNTIVVNLSGRDNVQVQFGGTVALNPIRTNEIYKQDCSRVITLSGYAELGRLIVINGDFNN